MGKKRKQLTQEEIWDDSALIDSWNEAYEEYKYYHSIHARGEKVNEVLDAYEREESTENFANEKTKADIGTEKLGTTNGDAVDQLSSDEEGEIAEGAAAEDDGHDNDVAMSHVDEDSAAPIHAQQSQTLSKDADNVTVDAKTDHADASVAKPAATREHRASSGAAQTLSDSSIQDPALKSLMMSWYWAGYYTGLYEGQRQAASHGPGTGPVAPPGPTSDGERL